MRKLIPTKQYISTLACKMKIKEPIGCLAGVAPFLKSLFMILFNESQSIIGWSMDGKIVEVYDIEALSSQILPKYFRHTKFASFQRQLNYFGFKKLTKSKSTICAYHHAEFSRDNPQGLYNIRRKTSLTSKGKTIYGPSLNTRILEPHSTSIQNDGNERIHEHLNQHRENFEHDDNSRTTDCNDLQPDSFYCNNETKNAIVKLSNDAYINPVSADQYPYHIHTSYEDKSALAYNHGQINHSMCCLSDPVVNTSTEMNPSIDNISPLAFEDDEVLELLKHIGGDMMPYDLSNMNFSGFNTLH